MKKKLRMKELGIYIETWHEKVRKVAKWEKVGKILWI